jgi:hypothetical protein
VFRIVQTLRVLKSSVEEVFFKENIEFLFVWLFLQFYDEFVVLGRIVVNESVNEILVAAQAGNSFEIAFIIHEKLVVNVIHLQRGDFIAVSNEH